MSDSQTKTCVTCKHSKHMDAIDDSGIGIHIGALEPSCTFKWLVHPVNGIPLLCEELRAGHLVMAIVPIGETYPNPDDVPGFVSCGVEGKWWEPMDRR